MVGVLKEKFAHLNLTYSIGGQISFDVSPAKKCVQNFTGACAKTLTSAHATGVSKWLG